MKSRPQPWSIGRSGAAGLVLAASLLAGAPARADDTLMPSIIHEACTQYQKGKHFVIMARFQDESQLFDPKVIYRAHEGSHWKHAPFVKQPGTEDFRAVIKNAELSGPLEYFIEVFDEYGNGPARMGSPEIPIRVMPTAEPTDCQQIPSSGALNVTAGSAPGGGPNSLNPNLIPPPVPSTCERVDRPLYCEAWLWATIGGVVLVGAGVTAYWFGFRSPDETTEGSATVPLLVGAPDPTVGAAWGGGR